MPPLRESPNQGPYRPIRARIAQSGPVSPNQGPARRPMRGRLEANLYHLNIWGEAGGYCLGKSIVYMCLLPL